MSEDSKGADEGIVVECVDDLDAQLNTLKVHDDKEQCRSIERSCPICQDKVVHPVSLPCNHMFCYLCLKGVYARSGSCALCRQPIPAELVARPDSLAADEAEEELKCVSWMYEAKGGGWWLYEKRLSDEIELAFNGKESSQVKVQISGFVYIIDFEQMVQYRIEKPDRKRNIKREVNCSDKDYKGVAGIPVNKTVKEKPAS